MDLTTVAKPYANAIFEIAEQDNTHVYWRSILELGASIANDTTMRVFIASPRLSKTDKLEAITTVFSSALGRGLNTQEKTFVGLLLDNDRIGALPNILELFDAMSNLRSDAKVFHVISAYKLNKKEEDEIIKDLSDKYKATISIDTKIDENLVGGVVIREGDKVIDLSIRARVDALGSQLSVSR